MLKLTATPIVKKLFGLTFSEFLIELRDSRDEVKFKLTVIEGELSETLDKLLRVTEGLKKLPP